MTERRLSVTVQLAEERWTHTVTVDIDTAARQSSQVLADVSVVGRTAYASGLHIQGNDRGKNAFGWVHR